MQRSPEAHRSIPLRERQPVSAPFLESTTYRPGSLLAISIVLTPVLLALAGAAIALNTAGTVPIWLPILPLLWMLLLPALWLSLKSVRMSVVSLAVGRPWQHWREIPWDEIEHAERRWLTIRISSLSGETLSFMPGLLRDGGRLERRLLLKMPPHVMTGTLRQKTQQLTVGDIYTMPSGGLTGMLRTRPRRVWRVSVALLTSIGLAGLIGASHSLAQLGILGLSVALAGGLLAIVGLLASIWLAQRVVVTEQGIEVTRLFGASHAMRWHEIGLIERSPHERVLRFRGERRLRCPGPGLLSTADRNTMRALIHEYCLARGVTVVERRWLV
jgi:hypothetical protein